METKYPHLIVAYGSNLDAEDWKAYCERNDADPNCLQFEDVVIIPGYKLTFDTASRSRGGGVLNIAPGDAHVTYAGLYSTNDEGLCLLRRKEGVPHRYEEVEVSVIKHDGSEIRALTYSVPQHRSEGYVRPSKSYLRICKQGYESIGIDTQPLLDAADNIPLDPLRGVFTYGTLMRGERNFPSVQARGVEVALMGQIFGQLSTNGSFPGLDLSVQNFAWGDYFVSKGIEKLLADLDIIEGFKGYGNPSNFYRRTCVWVDVGAVGQRLAWVYVRDEPFDTLLMSNDWRALNGNRTLFTEQVVDEHARNNPDLKELLRNEINRFGKEASSVIDLKEIAQMLEAGTTLSEHKLAQISGNWTALI